MKTKRIPSRLAFSILFASASSLVPAATFNSVATGNWGDTAAWDVGGSFPNTYTADSAIIGTAHTVSYDGSIPTLGGNLAVANGNSITINGGTLTQTWVPGAVPPFGTTIAIGLSHAVNGTGTLIINGGSFISGTANAVAVGVSNPTLGPNSGNGTVNINDGSMVLSAAASSSSPGGLGLAVGINAGATGAVNVGDGVGAADSSLLDLATNNVLLTVGGTQGGGAGSGTGTVTVKSDGRINSGTAEINVGEAGGNGTLNVNGGTIAGGTGALNIGRSGGTGNFNVTAGSVTTTGEFNVGRDAGSTGTATLSGGTVSTGVIRVGRDGGTGNLNISGTTLGSSDFVRIGTDNGTGTLTISGGALNSTNHLAIGADGGVGTVNQTGGSVTYGQWAVIGLGGGAGTSQYDISGGNITSGAGFEIGADRQGTMNISGTANVSVPGFALGVRSGGIGIVNKTGGTLQVNNLGIAGAQAGNAQGTFNLTGGTTTIVGGGGQSYLGNNPGSVGTLNISNGAVLNNTSGQDHQIGFNGGTGNINISGGGVMNHNWWFNLARGAGSVGNVTVDGAGSAINITGADARTNIGEDGTGTLTISNGGSFSTQGEVAVGRNGASSGTLAISDAGSSLNLTGADRHLYVGGREGTGNGTMTITGGALNLNGNRVQIADSGNSTGIVNITGGQITNSQWFHVGSGAGANGTLNVNFANPADSITSGALYVGNGGSTGVTTIANGRFNANDTVQVGRYGGGVGTLNISGPNSIVSAYHAGGDDFVRIGMENGNGTVNISNGGKFTSNNSWFAIGQNNGSVGATNIQDAGSELTTRGLIVGWFGNADGTLNISNGAVVNNRDREVSIGRDYDGVSLATSPRGIVNVTSGGVLNAGPNLRVGHNTTGTLNINNGTVNAQSGWTIVAEGGASNGTVNLNGGTMNNADWMVIGSNGGSTGTVNITDGTLNVNQPGDFGRLITGRFGTGVVNQSGGSVNVGNWFIVGLDPGGNGTYNFSGGSLNVQGNVEVGHNGSTGVMNITHGNAAGTTITGNAAGGVLNAFNTAVNGGTGTLNITLQNATDRIVSREFFAGNGTATTVANGTVNLNKGTLETQGWSETGRNNGTATVNITGPESIWHIGTGPTGYRADAQIGYRGGTGTVNISNGGTVNHNWWFVLGRAEDQPTSTGTINVDGAGSTLNLVEKPGEDRNMHLVVGEQNRGVGYVNILNGGVYNHLNTPGQGGGEIKLGQDPGSTGTMTVSGAGSAVNAHAREFRVGLSGTGTLNINDGGVVNFTSINESGANVDGNFGVGHGANAAGTINMNNGTLNVSAWALFGAWDGAASTANINMVNSTINIMNHTGGAGHLFFGDMGTATINQEGGAINVAGWSAIGRERGGNSFYNLGVGGGGGSFTVGDSMHIGRQSHGTVNIGPGATFVVTANHLHVGMETSPTAPSSGVINNNGGLVQVAGEFNLGRNGGNAVTGIYTQTGGQLLTNFTAVGRDSAQGTMNIVGGTVTNTGEFNIGMGGGGSNGTVNLTNATMNVNGWLTMGRDTGGSQTTSTLNIGAGGVYNHAVGIGGDALIGWQNGSVANVNITNGGQMNYAWWFRVGVDPGSTGNITIDGAGSKLRQDSAGDTRILIGESGTGNLTVSNGGVFEVVNSNVFTLGGNTDTNGNTGVGTMNISGAGSLVKTNNWFRAGAGSNGAGRATGTVNIVSGGTLEAGAWIGIGHEGGNGVMNVVDGNVRVGAEIHVGTDQNGRAQTSNGVASITGASSVTAGGLIVGRNGGTGVYTQNDTSTTQINNEMNIGWGGGGVGTVNVNGGTLNVNGWTTMGRDGAGQGTLNVTNGGRFTHLQGGGDFLLGWINGSSGAVNVTNGGQVDYNAIVRMAVDAGSLGLVNIDGAGSRFEQRGDARFIVGESGNAAVNVSNSGLLKVGGGLILGGHPDEVDTGTGTLTVSTDGRVQAGGEINAGFDAGSTGNINVTGGTVSNNSWFIVGRAGTGVYNQSGGRVWNTSQELRVGNDAGSTGTMNITGGNFNSFSHGMIGEAGTGTVNVTGGIVGIGCCAGGTLFVGHLNGSSGTLNIGGGFVDVGAGSVEFNSQGGATVSVLNLNGGILNTQFLNNAPGAGNLVAKVNANYGTLQAARNEADFIRGFASSRLELQAGGLAIDSNSYTVTVNASFSGVGGLTKGGFGQLNLTNTQAYTGNTAVRAGTLHLDFSTVGFGPNLVPNTGLTLGGGTLRATSAPLVNAQQSFTTTTLDSGSSSIELLSGGASAVALNLGGIARTTAGGTLDVNPGTGAVTTTNTNTNGILGNGITFNGNTWAIDSGAGVIGGLADAAYDSGAFAPTANFDTLKNGGGIISGGPVNSLRFGRAGADTIALVAPTTVTSGGILVASAVGANQSTIGGSTLTSGNGLDLVVIQNNADPAGLLAIASQITGGVALTKSGPGLLVLANPLNNYTGGTFINAGPVAVSADSMLGDVNGVLTLSSRDLATAGVLAATETFTLAPTRAVILNGGGGGFSVAAGKTLTINQDIGGPGGLGKLGSGTLVLGGFNTYSGGTAIYEGSLQLNGTIASTAEVIIDGNLSLGLGAAMNSTGTVDIARTSGLNVTVALTDATLTGGEMTVGNAGNAAITMTGVSMLAATCDLYVGRQNGSNSSVTSTGGGSVIAQKDLNIGAAGGASGSVSITDGSLAVGNVLRVGSGGGVGVMNLAGTTTGSFGILEVGGGATGTLNISGTASLQGSTAGEMGYINVGINNPSVANSAVVNQTGGSVGFNSWMTIGLGGGSADPTNAQYNLSGGTIASPAGIEVGADHGGTLSVSGTGSVAVGVISIGHRSTGQGVLNVSGGTVTTNEITIGHNADNAGGTASGVLNLTGGLTTVNGTVFVSRNGGGGSSTGIANLSGGELRVNSITRGGGVAAQLNFNGTVIKPNANSASFLPGFDSTNSEVQAGGAIFNTDGRTITVDNSLDGVGGLTKDGIGKLTLSGNSSYAGGVNLNQGTLSVRHDNALGTGTIVGNGGILSFDNSAGAGLIEGRLAGGFNTGDAIPYDAIRLGTPKGNTTNAAEFGDNTTWGYRGKLVVPAGPDVTWSFAEQFDDSVRLLIDGNQILNDGTWNNPTVGTVTLAAGEHSFEVRFGQGGGGVGPNNGWGIGFGIDTLGRNSTNPADYVALTDPGDGSRLRFDDGGTASYTLANAATLNVDTEIHVRQFGATINGNIGGAGGINKTGNGTLTLGGTNTYAGTTNIAAGTVQVGTGGLTGTLGAGPVSNSGQLVFNRDGVLNVPNPISGAGTVRQNGPGVTDLAGANTYTGATTVDLGTLRVSGSVSGSAITVNALGTLGGTGTVGLVTVNGGTIAPGASPGTLNTGNVLFNGGTLALEFNGNAAGMYDQLNVVGTVTLQSNVALALNFGYTAAIGDTFKIVNNDLSDAIGGPGLFTFAGTPLNDGDMFSDFGNFTSLTIDYNGGDGNDVILAVVPEPGSLVMLMGGLAVLAGARRRRK